MAKNRTYLPYAALAVALFLPACESDPATMDAATEQTPGTTETANAEWDTLFNGQDLDGWITGQDNAFIVENGELTVDREPDGEEHNGDYLWTEDTYEDFELELEFKVIEGTNSGIFIRTSDIQDPVFTGIEAQVANSYGSEGTDKNGTAGAIYDLVAPTENAINAPGEWNTYKITALDNMITVELNGTQVSQMNVDEWTTAEQNPDGTPNKFTRPIAEFARDGHIGLQDHGQPVWYRNIRVRRL